MLIVWPLMRSPWGRVLKGIREDEDAVRALGKNVFAYKMQALIVGGVFGALGGIVYALPSAVVPGVYVTIADVLHLDDPAARWSGHGVRARARLGDLLGDQALPRQRPPGDWRRSGLLPFMSTIQARTLRFILVGVALMLLVIFRPQGILGNKKELTFVK